MHRRAAPAGVLLALVVAVTAAAQWRADPDSPRGQRERAIGLVAEGRHLEAVTLFDAAGDAPPPLTARELAHWGTALQRLGRSDAAREKYEAALALEPQHATVLSNLGALLARTPRDREEGTRLLERALRLEPGNPAVLQNLGWAYLHSGRTAEAVNLLQRGVAATPPSHPAYAQRARDLAAAERKLPRRAAAKDMPNILLVLVDTLRADHLGAYGYARDTSPHFDALAQDGVRFEHAISQAPWTAASVASLFTGLYPSAHGLDGGIDWGPGKQTAGGTLPFALQKTLSPSQETLAELLRRNGYGTAAFVSNVYMNSIFGLAQGFETYDDRHLDYSAKAGRVKRRGEATNRRVFEWLAGGPGEPFLLVVHYNDPHWPYDPPSPFGREFVAGYAGGLTPRRTAEILNQQGEPVRGVSDEDLRYLVGLYDGEIRYADEQLGRLLAQVRSAGLARPLLTVVTADHGEEFLDHGSVSHGYTLYEEQIRVPLLLHWPGRLEPRAVAAQVQLVDLLPTLLELAGVDERPEHVQGRSLAPLLAGAAGGPELAFAEATYSGERRAVRRRDGRKLIVSGAGEAELFDLAADPGERANLLPADASPLRAALARFRSANQEVRAHFAERSGAGQVVLDEGTREQLEALGYGK